MQISTSGLKNDGCCGGGMHGKFTMDTPMPPSKDFASLNISRVLGHAVNNKKLASMKPGQNTSAVMTRANNLASLTAAMLLQIKPERRQQVLIDVGGLSYAQHILDFTEANPAKLEVTDALRFSLALNFMLGILDHMANKGTFLADGYMRFARLFKDAQDQRAGRPIGTTASASGLSGLGLTAEQAAAFKAGPTTQYVAPSAGVSLRTAAIIAPVVPTYTNTTSKGGVAASVAAAAKGALTDMEKSGYRPPPEPANNKPEDWNKVGVPQVLPAAKIQSRDSSGRCRQWSPTDPCYPAPADAADVMLVLVQADACGLMTAGGDPLATLQTKQRNKLAGVRKRFAQVFARPANNAEAEYYAKMRWCASDDPRDEMVALTSKMIAVREAIEGGTPGAAGMPMTTTPAARESGPITPYDFEGRTALSDIGDSLKFAAAAAFDFLGKLAAEIANILCAGFKAIFGPVVGGVICEIITFVTNMMVGSIAAIVDIVIESLSGTFEFIKLMVAGQVENAFLALLRSMGRVIFSLAAPMMVPVLMMDKGRVIATRSNGTPVYEKAQGPSMAEAFAALKVRADRVTKREPLWPIMVVMAVMGVFSAVSGNVLGAITGLIVALAPMVATFISEPLQKNIVELAEETLETIEAGIAKFIKFILLIFNGAMSIKGLIGQFRAQMAAFFSGKGAGALTGDTVDPESGKTTKASPAQRIKYVLEKLTAGIKVITDAFKDFNVKDIMKSAGPLLMLIPDLLLAILPDDAKASMPSLTEWKDAVKQSNQRVEDQEATLKAAALDIFDNLTLGTQKDLLLRQSASWSAQRKDEYGRPVQAAPMPQFTPQEAAAMAAPVFGQQFKNKANYPAFIQSFKAELLKV